MAGEYMNQMGSYPQYGMGPQVPPQIPQQFNPYAGNPQTQLNPFQNLANFYTQQAQQRLGVGQMSNMMQGQPQAPSAYTIRPASNIDEVRATPIDIMSTNVFVNLANDEIYISKLDDKGLKAIKTYKLVPEGDIAELKEEIKDQPVMAQDFSGFESRIKQLEKQVELLSLPSAKSSMTKKKEVSEDV